MADCRPGEISELGIFSESILYLWRPVFDMSAWEYSLAHASSATGFVEVITGATRLAKLLLELCAYKVL